MKEEIQAISLFADGYLCSQSVLKTFAPQFKLEPDTAARLAAPFGAGIARRGETCGAVSGAFMVLGLRFGHTSGCDDASKERTYDGVNDFISLFEQRNGSIRCNELLNCDISTPDGLQSARDAQLFQTRCPKYVQDAVEIVKQLMETDDVIGNQENR
ncbi:MAG: C-GCAxxG-C-C family protein [Anaerolineales bacterium]